MKAITFLGTGAYSETTYVFEGKRCQTNLFPEALCEFFVPDHLLVVVTEAARAKWWAELEKRVGCRTKLEPLSIPEGRSESDLWAIFTEITGHIQAGEEIIFDITHSFRTLPMLSFLAAAYLKVAKDIKLKGMYYGAFEAREPASVPAQPTDESPVFDLTLFLTLLDWSTAADQFIQTFDGRPLAALLGEAQNNFYKLSMPAPGADRPTQMNNAGRALEEASYAASLAQAGNLIQNAAKVVKRVEVAREEVARFAPPFGVLLDTVLDAYRPLSIPPGCADARLELEKQWRILNGYFERKQVALASTLAREWMLSLLCWLADEPLGDRDGREAVGDAARSLVVRQHAGDPAIMGKLQSVQDIRELAKLWDQICQLRNQVAHCGMAHGDTPADTLERSLLDLHRPIKESAIKYGVIRE